MGAKLIEGIEVVNHKFRTRIRKPARATFLTLDDLWAGLEVMRRPPESGFNKRSQCRPLFRAPINRRSFLYFIREASVELGKAVPKILLTVPLPNRVACAGCPDNQLPHSV